MPPVRYEIIGQQSAKEVYSVPEIAGRLLFRLVSPKKGLQPFPVETPLVGDAIKGGLGFFKGKFQPFAARLDVRLTEKMKIYRHKASPPRKYPDKNCWYQQGDYKHMERHYSRIGKYGV
jgi:hypothetical protein